MKCVFIMVLDFFGIGVMEDVDCFGDVGVDMLGYIVEVCVKGEVDYGCKGLLNLLNLICLGLVKVYEGFIGKIVVGMDGNVEVIGVYVWVYEFFFGKDILFGYWEIVGVLVLFDWGYFSDQENSFLQELLDKLVKCVNLLGYFGNCYFFGMVIFDQFGEEYMKIGKLIFYIFVDLVFQIVCYEEIFGFDKLYELCEIVCEELIEGGYNIGCVIVCFFVGDKVGNFQCIGNCYDLVVELLVLIVLQKLVDEKNGYVVFVGKIVDIYVNCGIIKKVKVIGLDVLFDVIIKEMKEVGDEIIVFINFVDFDFFWGYCCDVVGYVVGLELFDCCLLELMELVGEDDILIFIVDYGCDLIWIGIDYICEYILVLVYGLKVKSGLFGYCEIFVDIGQIIVKYFGMFDMEYGKVMF